MSYTITLLVLCVYIVCKGDELTIEWNVRIMNNDIDASIINFTRSASTITQCSFTCSILPVENSVSFYFIEETAMCHCNSHDDERAESNSYPSIQYGKRVMIAQPLACSPKNNIAGLDCLDLYEDGYYQDGLYRIVGWDGNDTCVRCDMTDGGWTIIQKRFDGSVDFRQDYDTCRLGFGNVSGEYWIGLENMHSLTAADSELEVTLETFPSRTPSTINAYYRHFSIDSAENGFKIFTSGFTRNCGDSFSSINAMKFSTPELDNDMYIDGSCVDDAYGSWWYNHCAYASLNGRYYDSLVATDEAIRWYTCFSYEALKSTEMKIRRVN